MAKEVGTVIEATPELLRYVKVPPTQFKELRDSLGLSNKEAADAIHRTLSRVSELTNSKGASMAIYQEVEIAWRAAAEAKATRSAEA